MIDRRGILKMLVAGSTAPVVVRKRLPQKNKFRVEKIKPLKLDHNGIGFKYICRQICDDGTIVDKRAGLILTEQAGTKAWGECLKGFGEMLIKHSDYDYRKDVV